MTTSQRMSLKSVVSLEDTQLTPHQLGYMNARAKSHAHMAVLQLFMGLSEKDGLTRAFIARRLGKKPEQITRWLGAPGNWTLDTLSSLLAAMGYEPVFDVRKLSDLKNENEHHQLAGVLMPYEPVQIAASKTRPAATSYYSPVRVASQSNGYKYGRSQELKIIKASRQVSQ